MVMSVGSDVLDGAAWLAPAAVDASPKRFGRVRRLLPWAPLRPRHDRRPLAGHGSGAHGPPPSACHPRARPRVTRCGCRGRVTVAFTLSMLVVLPALALIWPTYAGSGWWWGGLGVGRWCGGIGGRRCARCAGC